MNRRFIFSLVLAAGTFCTYAQTNLVPRPVETVNADGILSWKFKNKITVSVPAYKGDSMALATRDFTDYVKTGFGLKVSVKKNKAEADIVVRLNPSIAPEGYKLNTSRKCVEIEASRPAGFFYALQTLKQLLPVPHTAWAEIPKVSVQDEPRFGWRGFMLDEGRHFYGKEAVKRVLDIMATYKMNRFHWHLTEDQGWRVEIKKYPKLTSVGAWRTSRVLPWGDVKADDIHYGGFYTQADIKEIVDYAHKLFIEIVPEVDIPGHSQAAVAAYPELLACDPENPHGVWVGQGVSADVINVAKPEAVQFAKDVINELTKLFPFGYLHLGGDECPTQKWENNEACRKQLAELGSKNYRDLQLNFYRQLQQYMATLPAERQRRLIFWNEVIHGNTDMLDNPVIMSWIGADRDAKIAAERGMDVILTPQIPYYINRKQSNDPGEPHTQGYGTETVEAVYNYVPAKGISTDLLPHYMGVQGNFWTEWVEDASTVEYLMLPRLAAIAEAAWTPQGDRTFPDFKNRILPHGKLYKYKGWNYGKHLWK